MSRISKSNKSSENSSWPSIGTVVGNTSTDRFSFILKSWRGKLGDIIACNLTVPTGTADETDEVIVWARIVGIERFNPFFPAEAAQELVEEGTRLLDTVLSTTREHLEAQALILGTTTADPNAPLDLSPLTYPVKPSEEVLYPPTDVVQNLLTGKDTRDGPIRIGSLIGRKDVRIELSAKHIVSRHLAILAMTGGGKTVATRRIIREFIDLKYPLIIFDPHGDYLGLYEKQDLFKDTNVRIFFPKIQVNDSNRSIISSLIDKMAPKMTDPQREIYDYVLQNVEAQPDLSAIDFIDELMKFVSNIGDKNQTQKRSASVVLRILRNVRENLIQMEANNQRLRKAKRFQGFNFEGMPNPSQEPDEIIFPGQVSIFYLAGYDHLNQSTIVSIVLEALFSHRSELRDTVPPFQAIIEEAHNFIPSRNEGIQDTPSLFTIRKVITEGRKFGTGLILISQRPSRLDETTLAQCNSFLVLRIVNPNDKRFVRNVMENLTEADADLLQSFGPGQGIVSGQAVKFPLLVRIDFDQDLISRAIGDEDFVKQVFAWKPTKSQQKRKKNSATVKELSDQQSRRSRKRQRPPKSHKETGKIKPEGF